MLKVVTTDTLDTSTSVLQKQGSIMDKLAEEIRCEGSGRQATTCGYFLPSTTELYKFHILSEDPRASITVDGVVLPLKSDSLHPNQQVSGVIRLLNGQSYRIESTGITLAQLNWSTSTVLPMPLSSTSFVSDTGILTLKNAYQDLHRLQALFKLIPLDLEELQFFLGGLNLAGLDLNSLSRLQHYHQLRQGSSKSLMPLLKWLYQPERTGVLASVLGNSLGFSPGIVSEVLVAKYPSLPDKALGDLCRDPWVLLNLRQNIQYLQRIRPPGASTQLLYDWAFFSSRSEQFQVADKLRQLLVASNETVSAANSSLAQAEDILREHRRAALIAYLLQQPLIQQRKLVDSDSLFEYFLIDVNMGPMLKTSRIQQAIATIQLYVQRCLLGLETHDSITPLDIDVLRSLWSPLQKYTLWEANRKTLLYPENWIDPTLRDNKSEPFKALETTCLQKDLNQESIAAAVQTYILDVETVSRLDVQAYLWENEEGGMGRFHFFAKTRVEPFQFFYRRLDLKGIGSDRLTYWNPWTRLDLTVPPHMVDSDGTTIKNPGAYLIPTVVKGRLYLFIPEIAVKTAPLKTSDPEDTFLNRSKTAIKDQQANESQWEVKMSWSECRQGQWSPKCSSPDSLIIKIEDLKQQNVTSLPPLSSFRFRVRARDEKDDCKKSASFENGISDVLVIDVESWYALADQEPSNQKYRPVHLGQFEMRDSQMYLTSFLTPAIDAKSAPSTIPTSFGKLVHPLDETKKTPLSSRLPEYLIAEQKDKDGNLITYYPLLIDSAKLDDVYQMSWTLSFDDTQYSRPLGLLVDVSTVSRGSRTYFAYPPRTVVKPEIRSKDLTNLVVLTPFDNQASGKLVRQLAGNNSLDEIYQQMRDIAAQPEGPNTFGRYASLFYHEQFSPYSIYHWELGFHVISLLMERLLATSQFELALQVARRLFDPTIDGSKLSDCWLFPPFKDTQAMPVETTESLLEALKAREGDTIRTVTELGIQEWRDNPFNPFAVARSRPLAYQKRAVMKYIEILIAAGDELFKQQTSEAIPLAIQRYVEAAHIFGPAMRKMKRLAKRPSRTYKQICGQLDAFSDVTIDMELEFPFSCLPRGQGGTGEDRAPKSTRAGLTGILFSKYFAVPANPKLLALRSLIDDRLTKIRNCQDINGKTLKLPLFSPSIDPGLLVQAQASGGGLSGSLLLDDLDTPMPNYRFIYLVGKASELVTELKVMSDMFLTAREKRDSEALTMLKMRQESLIQTTSLEIKQLQKEEAKKSIEVLEEQRRSHETRLSFYLALIGESSPIPGRDDDWNEIQQSIDRPTQDELRMSPNEKTEFDKAEEAAKLTLASSIMDSTASYLMALPNLTTALSPMGVGTTLKIDAENFAKFTMGMSSVVKLKASMSSDDSSRASRKAQLIRQLQDRRLQANLAARDIKGIDKQITNAEVRIRIADAELAMQKIQIDHARETEEWYKSKYTSEKLYAWMENTTRSLAYETYSLAIDLAKKAEKCFRFERGDRSAVFLNQRGYWDSARDGIFSAQSLFLALKRMEIAYMERSSSNYQITKTISLRQINPDALLTLRQTGQATFSLPEILFDLDFPGHYMRRIKSIALSMPCITGPYTSLNCTLSLLEHRYRVTSAVQGDYIETERDERFRTDRIPTTSIAVSDGQSDSGVFELDFKGERYLPFENAGVISTWKLELPTKWRQFDYSTISDAVLTVKYTALEGGLALKKAAGDAVTAYMKNAKHLTHSLSGLHGLLDVKNDFSSSWNKALAAGSTNTIPTLALTGVADRLPFWSRGESLVAGGICALYAVEKRPKGYTRSI
ncbi:hypothetical protein N7454_001542 [Penicillium verhagenii]|nr:hypothetical protein N7454_001542 [Penicillium verhagenii]